MNIFKKVIICVLCTVFTCAAIAQNNTALVIGIGDYPAENGWRKINGDKVILLLQKEQFDLDTEEGKYFYQLSKTMIEDAEWLKTIAYMKQGKWKKAKKLLKKIASGDGTYKTEAQEILK